MGVLKKLEPQSELMHDIKFIFPIFAEDFISHILDEEDTVFEEIKTLVKHSKKIQSLYDAYKFYERNSIVSDFNDHLDEDEFKNIRSLTAGFDTSLCLNLEEKIFFKELESLDKGITQHAIIENDILFPKAIQALKELKKTPLGE